MEIERTRLGRASEVHERIAIIRERFGVAGTVFIEPLEKWERARKFAALIQRDGLAFEKVEPCLRPARLQDGIPRIRTALRPVKVSGSQCLEAFEQQHTGGIQRMISPRCAHECFWRMRHEHVRHAARVAGCLCLPEFRQVHRVIPSLPRAADRQRPISSSVR